MYAQALWYLPWWYNPSAKIEIFEFAAFIESIRLKFCFFTPLESLKAQVKFNSTLIMVLTN